MRPIQLWSDVFAVSGRNALTHLPGIANFEVIGRIEDGTPRGHYDNPDRNLFRIRQSVNRGPLGLDMAKTRKLDYRARSPNGMGTFSTTCATKTGWCPDDARGARRFSLPPSRPRPPVRECRPLGCSTPDGRPLAGGRSLSALPVSRKRAYDLSRVSGSRHCPVLFSGRIVAMEVRMNEPKKVEFGKIDANSEQVRRIADGLVGKADSIWPEDFEASGAKRNVGGQSLDLFQG